MGYWGERDDYGRDVDELMRHNLEQVHSVLDTAIEFFSRKRGSTEHARCLARLPMTLNEKVALATEVLPDSDDPLYTLRFTVDFARLTWLEAERKRITSRPQKWLMPYYHVAACFFDAASELAESLECEHTDFHTDAYPVPM